MRRSVVLGVAIAVVATAIALGVTTTTWTIRESDDPRITRVFIPAIKTHCTERAGLSGADLGYGFTDDGALRTIDPGDGSVSGLPAERLAALNECLVEYPIEPPQPLPRDPYSRNLVYDYFVGVLYSCLSHRVAGLPPVPDRADFVVRLYSWDPYRVLAPGRTLTELLELESACPSLPPYLLA